MKRIIIYRRDFSSYFTPHFAQREKDFLQRALDSYEISYWSCDEDVDATLDAPVILLTNSQTDIKNFSAAIMERVILMIHANSGYDNLTLEFVQNSSFPIVIGNEIRAQAVATYVLSCLFEHYSKVPFVTQWDKARSWKRTLISELDILILGHGHIGKIVAKILTELGAQVQVFDPYQNLGSMNLKCAQVVIPLSGLNSQSRGMIDEKFLSSLNEDVVIINGARGALIDEAALLRFLKRNSRSFAYLDVFEKEPFDPKDFEGISNIRLSSHIAGVYSGLDQKLIEYEAKVLGHYLAKPELFATIYKDALLKNRIKNNELI